MHRRIDWVALLLLLLGACAADANPKPSRDPLDHPSDPISENNSIGFPQPSPPTMPPVPQVMIPVDDRPAVEAATPPPPISGGTLLVTHDSRYAVAADPDRDRVSIVDLANRGSVPATIALDAGSEPGRLVEDDTGLVHIALRRAGTVVSIDVAKAAIVAQRPACAAPRGIAFDAAAKDLLIACADGQVLSMFASPYGLVATRVLARLEPDLRDVLVTDSGMLVSRFKRAELFGLAADGTTDLLPRVPIQQVVSFPKHDGSAETGVLTPTFAWRSITASDGRLFMLHQGSFSGEIDIGNDSDDAAAEPSPVATTGPYGGGAVNCDGVVQSELTMFAADGRYAVTQRLPGVLPVDLALDESSMQVAVVFAGALDPDAPKRELVGPPTLGPSELPFSGAAGAPAPGTQEPGGGTFVAPSTVSVMTFSLSSFVFVDNSTAGGCTPPSTGVPLTTAREPIAVAAVDGGFLVQTRQPASLMLLKDGIVQNEVELGGENVEDTGHTLFHHDAGGGVACASCHAEGGEDGHVWHFSGQGPRRTQDLHVGLEGTAPFHWSGDMPGVSELMEEVLVSRMGGVHESDQRAAALQRWLFALRAPVPLRNAADPAVERGHALFEGPAQCSKCHSGAKLTNNHNEDVGTGEALQVPSLIGVGERGPWMHNGCANTLRDRFDPTCGGGDKHGKTSSLDAAQIDDMVAYLESL